MKLINKFLLSPFLFFVLVFDIINYDFLAITDNGVFSIIELCPFISIHISIYISIFLFIFFSTYTHIPISSTNPQSKLRVRHTTYEEPNILVNPAKYLNSRLPEMWKRYANYSLNIYPIEI